MEKANMGNRVRVGAPTGPWTSHGMSDTGMGSLRPHSRGPTAVLWERLCHATTGHTTAEELKSSPTTSRSG